MIAAVETPGLLETLKAFQGLEKELRREANSELRLAAKECAGALAVDLRAAASSSPTPVARRVAGSIRVKSDRIPVVSIGGPTRVGRYGAPASQLVWGSEHGGANFAAGPGSYWIAPTVERFGDAKALAIFRRAVYSIMHRYGLT